jgi:hypothetical protein
MKVRILAAAILLMAMVACGDSEGGTDIAGATTVVPTATIIVDPTPLPTSTATVTVTPTMAPTATAPPGSGPTVAQLQRALLTANEVGPDAIRWDAGELDTRYPAVYVDYGFQISFDPGPVEFLSVELHDARNGVPDFRALSFLDDMSVNQLTQMPPTGFGTNGVRYRYNYDDEGERIYGEVVAWRQGQVVAGIQVEGSTAEVCVCDYAKLQHDKLTATIR